MADDLGDLVTLAQIERRARASVDPGAYTWAAAGAGEEITTARNRLALSSLALVRRVLRDLARVDLAPRDAPRPARCWRRWEHRVSTTPTTRSPRAGPQPKQGRWPSARCSPPPPGRRWPPPHPGATSSRSTCSPTGPGPRRCWPGPGRPVSAGSASPWTARPEGPEPGARLHLVTAAHPGRAGSSRRRAGAPVSPHLRRPGLALHRHPAPGGGQGGDP